MTFALAMNQTESPKKRSLSRLAAVQALYQQHFTGMLPSEVVEQFSRHNFSTPIEEISLEQLDRELFNDLVMGASARVTDLDKMIESNLAEGWSMQRMDPILLAILRCAIYEMWCRTDIPVKASIDEYVTLTADFYASNEPKFINGVLHKLAVILRQTAIGVPN
jgi:N utilization substance protein B